ncbi:PEP-CTERM sorting domain-containing protein [Massilia sp. CMS3.1]|uniref:PEP-CTERM sorting domain-containing protein n=1 Tax=Massilia sp. CMS3.1 TaxID=3373083 RepID=UPI003EE432A5
MHKLLRTLALALALGASQYAGAAVINFNNPAVIDIDNDTGRAVYREAGFVLAGDAAGFLTIDGLGSALTGGLVLLDGSTVSLTADEGGLFSFSGLVAGRNDAQTAATLSITGIFGDNSQLSMMFALSELAGISSTMWSGLTELRFAASGDLVIDDILVDAAQVPEPASIAMLLLGMGALVGARRVAAARPAP